MRKRITVLIIVVLIVALGTAAIGLYARNSWYDPTTNTAVYTQFNTELFKDLETNEEKIAKFRLVDGYYLEEEPVYKEVVKTDSGEALFTFAIYRSTRPFQPSSTVEVEQRVQYEFFAYGINYDLMRSYFRVDNANVVFNASNPVIRVKVYASNYDEVNFHKTLPADTELSDGSYTEQYFTLSEVTSYTLADYDSVDTKEQVNEIMYAYTYNNYYVSGSNEYNSAYKNFTNDVRIELTAFISDLGDDGREGDKILTSIDFDDFITEEEEIDQTKLIKANGASSVQERLANSGYYGWLFKTKIWWICTIAFVVFGLIGGLFYVAWLAEVNEKEEKAQRKQQRKK